MGFLDRNDIYKAFYNAIDTYVYEWAFGADEKEGEKIASYVVGMFDMIRVLLHMIDTDEADVNDDNN